MRNADTALYRAKERGRGRYVLFDPQLRAWAQERLDLEIGLRRAVADEGLHVEYQPVVDLATRRTVGAEALVRWHHPQLGPIPPDRFIPLAEETGLIVDIGAFVLRAACRELAELKRRGKTISIAVNVSAVQFTAPGLVSLVQAELEAAGVEPGRLVVELTENVLLVDSDRQLDIMRRLRALGVRLALDDFGTGHSSLTYLRRFPVDVVKIDRSFVRHIATQTQDRAIVEAVVTLARALHLEVVAEGVEESEDATLLADLGCHRAQGWLFGRPMPAAELHASLDLPLQRRAVRALG
jgi:EAL domain-containing protein (putative c-di-GMP-specific phosphodiesterase class I)